MKIGDYIEVTCLENDDEHIFSVLIAEEDINGVHVFKADIGLLFFETGAQYCKGKPDFKCRIVDPDTTYSGWTIGGKQKTFAEMYELFKELTGYFIKFEQYGRIFQGKVKKCNGVMMEFELDSFVDDGEDDVKPFIGSIACGFIQTIDTKSKELELYHDTIVSLTKPHNTVLRSKN